MFDFNRDGKLDSWERAAQFQFMDEMMKDDEKSIFDDDDEIDTFADAGLDLWMSWNLWIRMKKRSFGRCRTGSG